MSFEVTTAFVKQFNDNIRMLTQQMGSKLKGLLPEESIIGKEEFFDQIGAVEAQRRTVRHGDVVYSNTPHARRKVTTMPYWWADLVDKPDKIRMLIDPTSSYARAAAWAMGRAYDDVFIAALRGSAWTGEDGTTEVALPASQKIGIQFGTNPAADIGATLAKLREAKSILDAADVPEDLPRYYVLTSHQQDDLLAVTEIMSADYNTQRVLVDGKIDSFLGFKFVVCNRLPKVGTTRYNLAFTSMAGQMAIGQEIMTKVDEIPTKGYSTQVFAAMDIGGTRMEEVHVVEIACLES